MLSKSLTRSSSPLVGPNLDKALAPCIPCTFGGLLFGRISVVCLFISAGRLLCPRNMSIRSYLAYFLPQNRIVSTITTVFTAFSSFGLAAVSTWFASERWVFSRHKGKKWLQDSLDDWWDAVVAVPPLHQLLECMHVLGLWISSSPRRMRATATHVSSAVASVFHCHSGTLYPSSSENSLPSAPTPNTVVAVPQGLRRGSEMSFAASPTPPTTEAKSIPGSTVSFALPSEKLGMTGSSASPPASRVRFVQAVRNVIKMQQATTPRMQLTRTLSPIVLISDGTPQKDPQPMPVQSSRVAALVTKLRGLTPTQDLAAHQALVRHLQFSPNGKFLATSRFVFLRSSRRRSVGTEDTNRQWQ
jgi:hypothetical protein